MIYRERVDVNVSGQLLSGRTALVTGGGSGIGRATSRALAELGAAVAVLDRNVVGAHETVDDLRRTGGRAVPVVSDLADLDRLTDLVADIERNFGELDILINNAGIVTGSRLLDTSLDEWEHVPGITRTPITASGIGGNEALDTAVQQGPLANLLRRASEPDDIAGVIAFLCLPASRQITGQVIQVSAGAVVAAG